MISAGPTRAGRLARWLSPAGLFLSGLLLLLPFVAVSCEAPGGYGRGAAGSTTSYTGVDLLTGDAPTVDPPDQLRPPAQQRDDRLGVQPLAVAALVMILVALVASCGIADARRRRLGTAVLGTVAAVLLTAQQVTVRSLLESRLREQLTAPLPPGRQVGDYVQTQPGFWLCLGVLLAVTVANGAGLLRPRRDTGSPQEIRSDR